MSIEKWVNELQCEIDKLKRIVIDGGGFDPSAYEYNTPCIDLNGTFITLYRNEQYTITYTATSPCVVIFRVKIDGDVYPLVRKSYVTLTSTVLGSETLRYPSFTQNDYLSGMLYLAAGQTITAEFVDNGSDFRVCPIVRQQLTPRTTIIDRAIAAVKKVTKKRAKTTKGKE